MGEVERPAVAVGQRADHHSGEFAGAVEYRAARLALLGAHLQHHGIRIAIAVVVHRPSEGHRLDLADARDVALGMEEDEFVVAFVREVLPGHREGEFVGIAIEIVDRRLLE